MELQRFALKIGDSTKLAEAYWDKGDYFNWESVRQRDSAYYYLSEAQKIFALLGDDLQSATIIKGIWPIFRRLFMTIREHW